MVWLTAALAMLAAGALVAVIAAFQGGLAQGARALGDASRSPLITNPTWIALGTVANELAVAAALAGWWFVLRPTRRLVLPLGTPSILGVIGGVCVVFGLAPLAELTSELVHRWIQNDVTSARLVVNAARGASTGGLLLLLFALAVMPALAEEALFRGLLTAPFERRFALGLIVPSLLFGIFHLEPTQVAGTIVLGFGFALARLCTGTLLTSAAVHMLYNGAVVLAVRYGDKMMEHELSAAPVVIGLALAAVGGVVLARERSRLVTKREGGREDMPSWWF
jgi:membrane protease YdiL (CAAX protease family)